MSKNKKDRIERRKSSPDFKLRLSQYDDLLSDIQADYNSGRLLPAAPSMVDDGDGNVDLFSWTATEVHRVLLAKVEDRLKKLGSLRKELSSILETVSMEDMKKDAPGIAAWLPKPTP